MAILINPNNFTSDSVPLINQRGVHSSMKDSGLRIDGWQNLVTGLGTFSSDKRISTTFQKRSRVLDEMTLNFMYREDGIARRIIDLPVNDMIREWFTIGGDPDGVILKKMREIHFKKTVKIALKWARLFGGAIVVMGIDDGQSDMTKPLNTNKIRNIHFMHVFDRYRVDYSTIDLYQDPEHPKYGQPMVYTIYPSRTTTSGFKVHESRILRFDNEEIPEISKYENNGWNDSTIQSVYERLRSMGNIYGGVENIIEEFVISTLQIDNLQDMIAAGKEDLIKKRLNLIDLTKHILNTVLLDKEEKFEKKTTTVTGINKIVEQFIMALSMVTGIPVTILVGQSPAGLSATGESDIRLWYDKIGAMQEENILDQIELTCKIIMLSKEGPTKGKEIDNWEILFNPLWQPTDKEKAETRKIIAETDEIYINTGVLLPEEIAANRFGGDTYSSDTVIDATQRQLLEPEPE